MDRILIPAGGEALVGRGIIAAEHLLPARTSRQKAAVLTQPGARPVAEQVAEVLSAAGVEAAVRLLPDREAAKTLQVTEEVYGWLAGWELGRHDTVMGVGGGAVTDVAGFVAATWLRGVEVAHLPTTLLGAVDAAVGGKTGLNFGGKNLIGAFWHPSRVVVDLDVLDRIPARLRTEGLAEILKAGLIGDPQLVATLERHGSEVPLDAIVVPAITVKARVVMADPGEAGERAHLNYGHTIGHALEVAGGMAHGEAVALGMVAAGAISRDVVGFAEAARVETVIGRLGLPRLAPVVDLDLVWQLLSLDKKRDQGGLRMVLLIEIGRPELHHVDREAVAAGLAAVGVGS